LEDAAGVRQGSGSAEVERGDQDDTGSCSSSWSRQTSKAGSADAAAAATATEDAAWVEATESAVAELGSPTIGRRRRLKGICSGREGFF